MQFLLFTKVPETVLAYGLHNDLERMERGQALFHVLDHAYEPIAIALFDKALRVQAHNLSA